MPYYTKVKSIAIYHCLNYHGWSVLWLSDSVHCDVTDNPLTLLKFDKKIINRGQMWLSPNQKGAKALRSIAKWILDTGYHLHFYLCAIKTICVKRFALIRDHITPLL